MEKADRQTLNALSSLYRIVEAGEKGFATAATNLKNRGSKLLLKSYAQQRARFKAEILAELERLGETSPPDGSIFGRIHRGRVAIFSAMTIEPDQRERVVLKEAALGEKYAVQTYQKTLSVELPPETREIVQRQFEEVRQTVEDIRRMLGSEGKSMVVQLYDSEKDANFAVQALETAGFSSNMIEKVPIKSEIELYQGKGTTVFETILSGMVGGVVWGSLIGLLAGFGAVQTNSAEWVGMNSEIGIWALIALSTIMLAAFLGGVLGLFIGVGISEDDKHVYQNSAIHGHYLIRALVDTDRKQEARKILSGENIALSYASG